MGNHQTYQGESFHRSWSEGRRRGTRYAEELVDRNMKDPGGLRSPLFEEKHIRRILIGGTDENVSLFRGLLLRLAELGGRYTVTPMTASHTEVHDKRNYKAELHAGKRTPWNTDYPGIQRKCCCGSEDTLQAVNSGMQQLQQPWWV